MARFLNDDIKLRYGGRKGIKMSIDELRIKLWDYMKKIEDVDEAFNGINDDEFYALLNIHLYKQIVNYYSLI